MKLVALLLLVSALAAADDGGAILIAPDERAAIIRLIRDKDAAIERLEDQVRTLKIKLGCA